MKETFSNLKRLFFYGKKYIKNFIAFTIGSIFAIIINVFYPLFTARQLLALTNNVFEELIVASLIVLGILIFNSLNGILINRNTQVFFRGVNRDIQIDVAKEILKINVASIDRTSSGVFIERINDDSNEMSHVITRGMGYLTGILSQVGIFISILILNPIVALYYLLTSLVITFLYLLFTKRVSMKDKIVRIQNEKVSGLTSELVRGVRDIKMLNARDSFLQEIDDNITKLSDDLFIMRKEDRIKIFVINIITATFEFGLIILLIYLIRKQMIGAGLALVLYNYHSNIYENLMAKIGSLLSEIKAFNLSCSRVFSLLGDNEFKKEKFGNKHLDKVAGNFEFKDVTFGYDERVILDKLSFKVNANETVGFVGKSGVGKTTIFNLLCKMYDIQDGKILIDGVNIKELDEDSIRGNITIISQNPYIFNMSIRDNLRLVKSDVTDEEIKLACKSACLDEFIETLPEKYNTVVGEGGVTLSGGQRQRLAIARAFIQKTEIILFDEATSALDNDTQMKIQQAIDNLKSEYTILIIAHRFSTIINCDRIYFMEDGHIIASGTHKELLKSCSSYKKLYESEIKEKK